MEGKKVSRPANGGGKHTIELGGAHSARKYGELQRVKGSKEGIAGLRPGGRERQEGVPISTP